MSADVFPALRVLSSSCRDVDVDSLGGGGGSEDGGVRLGASDVRQPSGRRQDQKAGLGCHDFRQLVLLGAVPHVNVVAERVAVCIRYETVVVFVFVVVIVVVSRLGASWRKRRRQPGRL